MINVRSVPSAPSARGSCSPHGQSSSRTGEMQQDGTVSAARLETHQKYGFSLHKESFNCVGRLDRCSERLCMQCLGWSRAQEAAGSTENAAGSAMRAGSCSKITALGVFHRKKAFLFFIQQPRPGYSPRATLPKPSTACPGEILLLQDYPKSPISRLPPQDD